MDIELLTDSCAKISVSAGECRDFGIDYESFVPDNVAAQLFLASVLARIEGSAMPLGAADRLTAEIFEQADGGLIIYVSGKMKPCEQQKLSRMQVIICRTPAEVMSSAGCFDKDSKASLYKLNGLYALIVGDESTQEVGIEAAKIMEYGRLISDTPLKLLSEL